MSLTDEFRQMLAEYDENVGEVERKKRPLDGILGFGRVPANDPCHEALDKKAEELVARALAEGTEGREADELTGALLRAESRYTGPSYAGMTLIALQRHAKDLIPRMSPEGRRELLAWYEKQYPRRTRFPIQKEICGLLGRT